MAVSCLNLTDSCSIFLFINTSSNQHKSCHSLHFIPFKKYFFNDRLICCYFCLIVWLVTDAHAYDSQAARPDNGLAAVGNFPNPSQWLAGSLGDCKDARLHSRRLRYLQIHSGELYLTYSMAIFLADSEKKKKKKKKKKKPWSTSGKSHHVETVSLQRSDRDRALSLVRSFFLSDMEWTVTCLGCCSCVSHKMSHS